MTLEELADLKFDEAGARLRARYLEQRSIAAESRATSRAFVDAYGDPLQAETLPAYVRALRRVDINAEFNSALLHTSFDTETPLSSKAGRHCTTLRPERPWVAASPN